ncbi:protein ENHANCED PSEUDOMONAS SUSCEPTIBILITY 1 [Gossypium hirsutum]|uniref:Protein ENHANCED PSEUDOMONAS SUSCEPTIBILITY 1 n=1 Tax=Gossypium hirsutum TaxID=3635 RepID=A0A1U8MSC8_GOSHI|nr:protein ENHANCED PSEUDOMONAS SUSCEPTIBILITY 1-like [Gossypium hirsutum]
MEQSTVRIISECYVTPPHVSDQSKQPYYLTTWDLVMLSVQYIQKGLLYTKPENSCEENLINNVLDRLKQSLSIALVHFYPLSGRLVTKIEENPKSHFVFVDCTSSPGAKFIHAAVDLSVSEIVSPTYVPLVVQSFFDHDRAINYDGHTRPLLSIQVTELVDGVFIGCSMNHVLGDGATFWRFFNALSEIFQAQGDTKMKISRPPVLEKWFPEGHGPLLNLPFTNQDEFITRFEAPELLERMFHFSAKSIAKLKERANTESNTIEISSFQSLSAFVWRSITKARRFPNETVTGCRLAINNRSRLEPALPLDYFGNSIQSVRAVTTAGELLDHNLGWAAWKLHQAVVNHTDKQVRGFVNAWLDSPFIYKIAQLFDPQSVMFGSSPRFNMYENEFGLGKALMLRSGYAHKFDGKVSSYPGREGGGSVDLEICLPPSSMKALELDEEFMSVVSSGGIDI